MTPRGDRRAEQEGELMSARNVDLSEQTIDLTRSTRTDGRAPRRGLVLGAGGVLGAAWTVGALRALELATTRHEPFP